jgi:hypothetical protein
MVKEKKSREQKRAANTKETNILSTSEGKNQKDEKKRGENQRKRRKQRKKQKSPQPIHFMIGKLLMSNTLQT